jgi:hypothetical protein
VLNKYLLIWTRRESSLLESVQPELNLDGRAHTPCFTLGVDKVRLNLYPEWLRGCWSWTSWATSGKAQGHQLFRQCLGILINLSSFFQNPPKTTADVMSAKYIFRTTLTYRFYLLSISSIPFTKASSAILPIISTLHSFAIGLKPSLSERN